jgi:hypothetical protein
MKIEISDIELASSKILLATADFLKKLAEINDNELGAFKDSWSGCVPPIVPEPEPEPEITDAIAQQKINPVDIKKISEKIGLQKIAELSTQLDKLPAAQNALADLLKEVE